MKYIIPWYQKDVRFKPGTVADIGNIRLYLRKTNREKNNKWRLYISIRTCKEDGVEDSLKREVAVAEFRGNLDLKEAQEKANKYLENFLFGILAEFAQED